MIRLDKYLSDMGAGTRQEVKKYIRQGRVCVDQEVVKKPEYKIYTDQDKDKNPQKVTFDGETVGYRKYEYYMLHKPAGVVSATEDSRDQTVIDLITDRKRKDLFPVGRLDKDTEGLLLITNDGGLAHRLLSPKRHVDKCYFAKIRGIVTKEDQVRFAEGVNIGTEDTKEWTRPARLEIVSTDEDHAVSEIRLTIHEGKFHQVKRMFEAVGKEVTYLKRESMGSLVLDGRLGPGEYRKLTDTELEELENL